MNDSTLRPFRSRLTEVVDRTLVHNLPLKWQEFPEAHARCGADVHCFQRPGDKRWPDLQLLNLPNRSVVLMANGMTISKLRHYLYKTARFLGDAQAVKRGGSYGERRT